MPASTGRLLRPAHYIMYRCTTLVLQVEAMGIPYVSMEELLAKSDITTLHCPLLPSTRHLINKERWVAVAPKPAPAARTDGAALPMLLLACGRLLCACCCLCTSRSHGAIGLCQTDCPPCIICTQPVPIPCL